MPERGTITVLVVEDDETHCDLVAQCLGAHQPAFELSFAHSCGEARRLLASRGFGCVLLDHSLPDGTGAELLDLARRDLLTTPVVAFSTSADPDVALQEFKGGCTDFVNKRDAFKGTTLARVVMGAISKYRTRSALDRAGFTARLVDRAGALVGDHAEWTDPQERLPLIYEAAVQTMDQGVLLIERRRDVVFANPGFKRILGLSEFVDLAGHPSTTIDDILTPAAAAEFRSRRVAGGRYESVLRGPDGSDVPVMFAESTLGPDGLLCAVTALHEIKVQQRALESKNRKLAELNEMADRFVDNVSHEFRTPLTVIKGFTEVIARGLAGPVTGEQREHLDTILDRTRDLAQMVEDLLDTSKLRAGFLRIDRRAHSLEAILRPLRPAISQKAQANKITVREAVPPNLPEVYADAEKVGRIILNLVVNAIKFSPEGSEVCLWAEGNDEGEVRIGVTDHGSGIAPENLALIFERFKQVGNPQRASTKGFGLGLNIASELAALNLGTLNVQSELGRGSTFSFTLPRHDTGVVVARLLERLAQMNEGPGFIALLGVTPHNGEPLSDELRAFLASNTYPMDLILESQDRRRFLLAGFSVQPDLWVKRLVDVQEKAQKWLGPDHLRPPRIELVEQWPFPQERKRALRKIIRAAGGNGGS